MLNASFFCYTSLRYTQTPPAGLFPGGKFPMVHQVRYHRFEGAFSYSIVPTISFAAHIVKFNTFIKSAIFFLLVKGSNSSLIIESRVFGKSLLSFNEKKKTTCNGS
jgi:hypothetical protein